MKLLLTGDWHITNTPPEKRIDNYTQAQSWKFLHILGLAEEKNCAFIIQPGDFFDSHKANDFLKRAVIKLLKDTKHPPILTIFGQHDLRYHSSDTKNTPLRVLEAAGVIDILGYRRGTPIVLNTSPPKIIHSDIHIYGTSWFEDIPVPETEGINILVMHGMIIKNEKIWEGQGDATLGNILLRNNRFDLIVSGDNHQSFTISTGKKHLVNCGSLMRMTTAQLDHKPVVYIYDTKDKSLEEHFIPIEPSENVFDLSEIEKEKKENKELEAFVAHLKDDVKIGGLDYAKNLKAFLLANKKTIELETLDLVSEVMCDE